MGDKVVKKIHEKSIINGVNGEKAPLSLLKKKLAFKDDKIKKQCVRAYPMKTEHFCSQVVPTNLDLFRS